MNDINFELIFFFLRILGLLLAPIIITVVGVFIFLNHSKKQKQRIQELQNFCAETGLNYTGHIPLHDIPYFALYRLFNLGNGHGKQIENAFRGAINGYQVSVFDYRYYVTFSNRKIRRQTVAMVASPRLNLPLFSLQPQGKNLLNRISGAMINDINFPAQPSFSEKYLLIGQDEARTRQIFDDRALSYFDKNGGSDFIVEGGGNLILFYRDETLASPNQMRRMIDEGLKIANLFAR